MSQITPPSPELGDGLTVSPTVAPYKDRQRILPRQHRIIDLALAGLSNVQIAAEVNMTPEGVGQILLAPLIQSELARRRSESNHVQNVGASNAISRAKQILEEASVPAANTLVSLLNSCDEQVQRQSANDILKQVYGGDQQKAASVTLIKTDQLNILMQAMKEDDRLHQKQT